MRCHGFLVVHQPRRFTSTHLAERILLKMQASDFLPMSIIASIVRWWPLSVILGPCPLRLLLCKVSVV
jgi:hypothetical protein